MRHKQPKFPKTVDKIRRGLCWNTRCRRKWAAYERPQNPWISFREIEKKHITLLVTKSFINFPHCKVVPYTTMLISDVVVVAEAMLSVHSLVVLLLGFVGSGWHWKANSVNCSIFSTYCDHSSGASCVLGTVSGKLCMHIHKKVHIYTNSIL